MGRCPICKESLQDALVVCAHCGELLPLRVVVVSEGSHGGGGRVGGGEHGSTRGKMQSAGGGKWITSQ